MYGRLNDDGTFDLFVVIGQISTSATGTPSSQPLRLYRCRMSSMTGNTATCSIISSSGPLGFAMFGQDFYQTRLVVWGADWNDSSGPSLSVYSMDLADPSKGWIDDTPSAGTRPTMTTFISGIIYNATLYIYGGVPNGADGRWPGAAISDTDVVAVDLGSRFSIWYPPYSTSTSSALSTTASSATSFVPSTALISTSPGPIFTTITASTITSAITAALSSITTILSTQIPIPVSALSSGPDYSVIDTNLLVHSDKPPTSSSPSDTDIAVLQPEKVSADSSYLIHLLSSLGGVILLLLCSCSYMLYRRRSNAKLAEFYAQISYQTAPRSTTVKDIDGTVFNILQKFRQDNIPREGSLTEMVADFRMSEAEAEVAISKGDLREPRPRHRI